jgi:hypothetical protein
MGPRLRGDDAVAVSSLFRGCLVSRHLRVSSCADVNKLFRTAVRVRGKPGPAMPGTTASGPCAPVSRTHPRGHGVPTLLELLAEGLEARRQCGHLVAQRGHFLLELGDAPARRSRRRSRAEGRLFARQRNFAS